jgi:hypothetical protein
VGTDATAHEEATGDAALDENARRYRSSLRPPDLDQYECDQKHESEHKQRHDAPVAPLDIGQLSAGRDGGRDAGGRNAYLVRETAPLQSQAQADHSGDESDQTLSVELQQLVA